MKEYFSGVASEEVRSDNFLEAVEISKAKGYEFVIEHQKDAKGRLTKTVLGWDVYIISYRIALHVFQYHPNLLKEVRKLHCEHVQNKKHNTNEVYLFAPTQRMIMNMDGFNYRKVIV